MSLYLAHARLGTLNPASGQLYSEIFNRHTFQVNIVNDIASVELCGALKVCTCGVLNYPHLVVVCTCTHDHTLL